MSACLNNTKRKDKEDSKTILSMIRKKNSFSQKKYIYNFFLSLIFHEFLEFELFTFLLMVLF